MKKILYILISGLLVLCGCTKEQTTVIPHDEETDLILVLKTPGFNPTKAPDEELLSHVNVIIFEDLGSGLEFRYSVIGYSISTTADGYQFLARIVPTDNPVRMYLAANAPSAVSGISTGATEEQVKTAITMDYTSAGFTDNLPMSAVLDLPGGLRENSILSTYLVRSVARVDVINDAANFTLTSVRVFRTADELQIIPNVIDSNVVTTPSIPDGTPYTVNTATFTATGTVFEEQIYIPESAMPTEADRQLNATMVVIGGRYGNDAITTYYRMDFVPDGAPELFGQILRNHRYEFHISEVLAPGWSTDEEASIYPSSQIETEIVVWDEITTNMVYDDVNYFGVSRRSVRLRYAAGSTEAVEVDTSLDTYRAYWSDEDGNILDESRYITLGGNFQDPDNLFTASISDDGTEVLFTSVAPYNPATAATKYLVLVAGRLRIVITVTQGPSNYTGRAVSIFNSTHEIGSYGNFVTGIGWTPEPGVRAFGLGNMLAGSLNLGPQNFGPGRTVDMAGIYISGVYLVNSIPRNYFQGCDVLYLTFSDNPPAADVTDILQWLEEDENGILIVQFDNASTNYTMMDRLGLATTFGNNIAPYTYTSDDAPDFIKYGPFGTLTSDFYYQCRDNTYGTIAPAVAEAAGFIPILRSTSVASSGYYILAVNPDRRIIISGDIDLYGNVNEGSTGSYLSLTATNAATMTIDPNNPAHVLMGNLWAWIVDVCLTEQE